MLIQEPSQLSCLGSLVGKSVPWKADGRGFKSHPRQQIFLWKMTVLGELCCVALPFCCVVVVALTFSASLGVIVHVIIVLPSPNLKSRMNRWSVCEQHTAYSSLSTHHSLHTSFSFPLDCFGLCLFNTIYTPPQCITHQFCDVHTLSTYTWSDHVTISWPESCLLLDVSSPWLVGETRVGVCGEDVDWSTELVSLNILPL